MYCLDVYIEKSVHIYKTDLATSLVVYVAPATNPSAIPSLTINAPKYNELFVTVSLASSILTSLCFFIAQNGSVKVVNRKVPGKPLQDFVRAHLKAFALVGVVVPASFQQNKSLWLIGTIK